MNTEADNTNITTYQYDLQGSLTKEQSADICKKYLYNDFHQCIQTDVIRGREEEAERLVQQKQNGDPGQDYPKSRAQGSFARWPFPPLNLRPSLIHVISVSKAHFEFPP